MALVDVFDSSLVQTAPGGLSAAMCACEAGDAGLAEWLVNEGLPADLRDEAGRTVLFYAAQAALPQFTSWLIGKQRLSASARARDGSTALASAVSSKATGSSTVVQQLLEAAASANKADKAGWTPLHAACQAGDERCVRLLLGAGKAKADLVDAKGRTAADVARASSMSKATVEKLFGGHAAEGPSETPEEAEKRELREKKTAHREETNWRTWRYMHPRRGGSAWYDDGGGVSGPSAKAAGLSPKAASLSPSPRPSGDGGGDSYRFGALPASAGSARGAVSHDEIPLYFGRAASPSPSAGAAASGGPGRLSRLKSWATGFRRSSKSPAPEAPPSPVGSTPRRQDSWTSLVSPR